MLPCFFELPFKSTLGLNVFGMNDEPEMDATHYLGQRINVQVGQLLVVSCFLWHSTAVPRPIYSKVMTDDEKVFTEHYVTDFDDRLHFYLGCQQYDVDDMNLSVPKGEHGIISPNTKYEVVYVQGLTNSNVLDNSRIVFKKKQIGNH
jgi:hypothetical protein